jgi:opacity protein-like surface antigen
MTRFAFAVLAFGFLISAALPAQAQSSRLYFAGYLGLNTYNDVKFTESATPGSGQLDPDNGLSYAGALGIRLSRAFRFEGEYSYTKSDFSSMELAGGGIFNAGGETTSKILFANLYYDLDIPWAVQPYIGAGLGYGWHSGEINGGPGGLSNASGDDAGFMYNVGAGLKYRTSDDLAFTAGYRYVDSFSEREFGNYKLDPSSHEFRLGMEWDLPVRGR